MFMNIPSPNLVATGFGPRKTPGNTLDGSNIARKWRVVDGVGSRKEVEEHRITMLFYMSVDIYRITKYTYQLISVLTM